MPRLKASTAAYSKQKSTIKKALKELGAENIKIDNGYYYFSGFATLPNKKIIYFSYHAARNSYDTGDKNFLIREAASYEDFGGISSNTYAPLSVAGVKNHIKKYFLN